MKQHAPISETDDFRTRFPKIVRKLRREHQMSQDKLAECIGKTPVFVCLIETGERLPGVETLITMADAFGTSLDSLVGRH